ncbi:DJ-1/PfpI family protein [Corynebacterium anserum]|uniref:DJ-1/PfpI family protein n=1 Tax=Corynebacterium anserum TaxID=2684406 RepID=A0A7G7YMB3_9CORY|nr:DJ-1/PfpI family protein [Corynebacterium anserum]QNH95633.1 DJ-1/PfpI family protein [Corynebacterium anserum]
MGELPLKRRVAIIIFEGFEVLDVFGPIELFSKIPDVRIDLVAERAGSVRSAQGVEVIAELGCHDLEDPDIILVPGGIGVRKLVGDSSFLSWLSDIGEQCQIVASVCTGSAVLAAAGLLEGRRATSNKLAFKWVSSLGNDITWEHQARWVEDGNRWSSAGVAAGMDMTAALIRCIFGQKAYMEVSKCVEYQPQIDSTIDPFARLYSPD